MKINKYRHPFVYYGISILGAWIFFFSAAIISHSPLWEIHGWVVFASILGLLGLCVPMVTAFVMILPDREMRAELKSATFNFKGIHWSWFALIILLPFAFIFLSQAISLLFGYSAEQFKITESFSFSAGIFPVWFLLIIAPIFEEFGWRTYGTHCIRRSFNLFTTCLIFGILWALWHVPLAFIKDYYHSNVVETGVLHSINYVVSLIPYLIFNGWVYYKTKRNMLIQIMIHLPFNFSMELFRTHPDTKIIYTVLFLIFCAVIVMKDRKFFFDKTFEVEVAR